MAKNLYFSVPKIRSSSFRNQIDAITKVVEAGQRHGKYLGRPAGTPEPVKPLIKQGFSLFQSQTDIGFMMAGAKRYLDLATDEHR